MLHGLEADSSSAYVKGLIKAFCQNGYDGVAMNFRSCSGEPNRLLKSYHSGVSEDLAFILNHVIHTNKYQEIFIAGYSLGGNVLLKYLGEKGSEVPPSVKKAMAISVPCDLSGACEVLSHGFRRWVYTRRFLGFLKEKVRAKAHMLEDYPHPVNMRLLEDFDDAYTAPIHGFTSAQDYYRRCSSKEFVAEIRVPTLLLNAQDDPFFSPGCFPVEAAKNSPFLHLETPRYGGHVGFYQRGLYYHEERALTFTQNNGTSR
ncbi:MAG: alpha/beta fold hydrolase [Bacteroidota bacterium]